MAQLSLYKFVNPGGVRDKNLESITINAQKFMIRKGGSSVGGGVTDRTNGMNAYGRKTVLGINRLGASINSTITTVSSINDNVKSLNAKFLKADKQKTKFDKFQLDGQKKLLKLKQDKDKRESNAARRSLDQASEKKSEGLGLGKMFAPIKNVAKKAAGGFLDFLRDLFQLLIKSALISGVLKWIMDPQNTEKVGKFFIAVRKIFEFFMGLINFGITNMLDGIVKIIDGNIFEKVIGVVQFLVGAFVLFKSLSWLRNPLKIIGDLKSAFNLLRMLPKALGFAAKAAKGILMAARNMPGWGKVLTAGAILFTAGATIPAMFPGTVNEQERKTDAAPGSNEDKIKRLEEQKKNLNPLDHLQGKGSEIDEQIQYLKTGKPKEYAVGGVAKGPDSGYPAILHGTEAIIPLDNKYTRAGGDPLANVTDGIKSGMSDSKVAKSIGDAMRLPFKAVGAALLTNLGNVVSSLGPVGETSKPFIQALAAPIAQSFGVPANLFDAITAKDKIKSGDKDKSDGESLADKIGTGNITIKNPSDSGVWSPGGNKTVRGLLADVVSGLLFMTKKVDKKGSAPKQQKIPDTTPNLGSKVDSADESSASAVEAAQQGKGSQDLSKGVVGASQATQQGQSSDQRQNFDASNAKANRHNLPFKGPDGVTNYEAKLNVTNGDYEVWKHNGIFGWQRLDISKDKNTLQKQKAFNQVRAFYIKHAQQQGLNLNYITQDDVKRRQELVKKYDAEAKAKGVDTSSPPPRNRRSNVGTNPPQKAAGGWISGPQSGYPVSLDGGNSIAFEGHGTEWVGFKKAAGGSTSSAFVIPYDTPKTKSHPGLTQKRFNEAKSGGYVLPFAKGGTVRTDPNWKGDTGPGSRWYEVSRQSSKDNWMKNNRRKMKFADGGKIAEAAKSMVGKQYYANACAKSTRDMLAKAGVAPKPLVTKQVLDKGTPGAEPTGTLKANSFGPDQGAVVKSASAVKEGDVVMWDTGGGVIGHVGVAIGGGQTVHNSSSAGYKLAKMGVTGMKFHSAIRLGETGTVTSSSDPSSTSSSTSTSTSSSGSSESSNWWDALGKAFSGDTAREMLGVKGSSSTSQTSSPAGSVVSQDLTKLSTEELKKMLRTDLTPTDAEFQAAKKAREEGKLKGLSGDALEREVLMATIKAKQGTPQAEIKPAQPATPTGSQVLQQSAQLKDAKSASTSQPQVATINNNQGTTGAVAGGGTIAINTAGGTKKNNTDFLVPMGSPFTNFVSPEALAVIK